MKLKILGIILIFIALCIMVHQYLFYDLWFQWEDLHHETWMIMFAFAGTILLLLKVK